MRLYLIRHAQSVNNANWNNPDAAHVPDAPLTSLGHQQAQHLAARIRRDAEDAEAQTALDENPWLDIYRIERLYCSPMHRAIQTALPLANALDQPLHVFKDLHEYGGAFQQHGKWGEHTYEGHPGMTRAQIMDIAPRAVLPEDVTDAGWWNTDRETFDAFSARALRLVARMRDGFLGEWKGCCVAWVMHADIINQVLHTLVESPRAETDDEHVRFGIFNTSVTRIDFDPAGRVRIRYTSRVDHLPAHMVTG